MPHRRQFFGDDRLPIMRRMILASTEEDEAAALEELRAAQKADFLGVLRGNGRSARDRTGLEQACTSSSPTSSPLS